MSWASDSLSRCLSVQRSCYENWNETLHAQNQIALALETPANTSLYVIDNQY